jgi:predicted nucleic acid-binding protein
VPGYLLDTNVLSEVIKKRPSAAVLARLRAVSQDALFASSVSVMEMRFGALRSQAGPSLWQRIGRDVLSRVGIIPFGEAEARRAGEILADLVDHGAVIGVEDAMIGATALVADLTVATRNVRHLGRIRDLAVEDWWELT